MSAAPSEVRFLSRSTTPDENEEWLDVVASEFETAFSTLNGMPLGVSVFGSARVAPGTPDYELGVEVGRRIAQAGYPVITGGGPGHMAAANQGAREAGGLSVGLPISLPFEEAANRFIDREVEFENFFTRKTVFIRYSCAFVGLPGGFGTLDELFEAITLVQTGKIRDFPIVLVGTAYWAGLVEWIRGTMLPAGRISPGDLDILTVTDDLDAMIAAIADCYDGQSEHVVVAERAAQP